MQSRTDRPTNLRVDPTRPTRNAPSLTRKTRNDNYAYSRPRSAMGGAVNFIREMKLGKDAKVVVLLPDSSRNYMSKFMADDWMEAHGFSTTEKLD